MAREYDKLVRDDIPAIIEADGGRPITHVAGDEEYDRRLRAKLEEECAEFVDDPSPAELADVLEVVDALRTHYGWSRTELEQRRRAKRGERGGFEGRVVLETVQDDGGPERCEPSSDE